MGKTKSRPELRQGELIDKLKEYILYVRIFGAVEQYHGKFGILQQRIQKHYNKEAFFKLPKDSVLHPDVSKAFYDLADLVERGC